MAEVWELLGEALRLYPNLFDGVDKTAAEMLEPALGVAALAGASTVLGHIAVLLVNRVHGIRLVVSMLLSIVMFGLLYVLQAVVTWTFGSIVTQRPLPLLPLIVVALTATAPLVFNFATILPHIGMLIGRGLQAWAFLVFVLGIMVAYGATFWAAFLFSLAGWLAIQVLSRVLQKPLGWAASRLWTLVTGTPTMLTADDILLGMPFVPVSTESTVTR